MYVLDCDYDSEYEKRSIKIKILDSAMESETLYQTIQITITLGIHYRHLFFVIALLLFFLFFF